MNIRELINELSVEIGAEIYSKDEALNRLIELQKEAGAIRDTRTLRREIEEREQKGNTAVSCRIAVSDVMHKGSKRTTITALTVKNGVEYGAQDKRPVKLLFLIAGKSGSDEYQQVKERLKRLLSDTGFTARLTGARSREEFLSLLTEREKVKFSPTPTKLQSNKRFISR